MKVEVCPAPTLQDLAASPLYRSAVPRPGHYSYDPRPVIRMAGDLARHRGIPLTGMKGIGVGSPESEGNNSAPSHVQASPYRPMNCEVALGRGPSPSVPLIKEGGGGNSCVWRGYKSRTPAPRVRLQCSYLRTSAGRAAPPLVESHEEGRPKRFFALGQASSRPLRGQGA